MVDLLVRGGAGVICGCNAIKMKHERSFGGEHSLGYGGASAERVMNYLAIRLREHPCSSSHQRVEPQARRHGTIMWH
jgi:hypothetical protein